jgi:GT2 family glycosyltransferase/transposase InsO family protein
MRSFKLSSLYKWLGLSKQAVSAMFKRKERKAIEAQNLLQSAEEIRKVHPAMGCRKMSYLLCRSGWGRDKTEELLLQEGFRIEHRINKRKTTHSLRSHSYKSLIEGLQIRDINRVVQSDITYYSVGYRFYYLVFIIDVYSKRIVGYQASENMEAWNNQKALEQMIKLRGEKNLKGLIHHSDRGSQYHSNDYVERLRSCGIKISMCIESWENAYSERINRTIKEEYLDQWNIKNFHELKQSLRKAVRNYNEYRPHWNLNLQTPVAFEQSIKNIPMRKRKKMSIYKKEEGSYTHKNTDTTKEEKREKIKSIYANKEIIVADNASTDDSVAMLRQHFPDVKIISLKKNYGFAQGYNEALALVQSDYYVLLNSDVEVTQGWLQPMLDLMQQKPDIAACMPKILSASDRNSFEYAGAAGGFMDKYGYIFCRGRLFHTVEKDAGQYDSETEVFWATGACCMINAKLFHKVGGFDIQFFAHMEEIDLCWRLKNAGYTIWYTPCSVVYHVGGGTLPQSSPIKTFLNYRNNLLMLYKNLTPQKRRTRILILRMILDGISAIHSLLKGDISVLVAVWKAHFNYRKLSRLYLPPDKTEVPPSYPSCVYQHSVVYQYFIKRRKKYEELTDLPVSA